MITLKTLTWSNCFSYGPNNSISLDSNNVTQILGSNGMGKSSIPLIIEEALYNKNSKGIKKADIPNRYIKEGYSIELEFDVDDKEYYILVDRTKAKLKVQLLCDGEDISSHTATNTYKTVQEILGIDFKTFSQLVYQSIQSGLQFLSATDTNRKKFLIDLLHLEDYLALLEIFKEAHKEYTIVSAGIRAQVETIEKWLESNKLTDTNPQELLNLEINTDEDEKALRSLSLEIQNIDSKNKKIIQNNKYKELLNKIDLTKYDISDIDGIKSYDGLQKQLGEINFSIRSHRDMVSKMEKLHDSCPTCEQPVSEEFKTDLISEHKSLALIGQADAEEVSKKIMEIKDNNAIYREYTEAQRNWEDLYRSIDNTLSVEMLDIEELEKEQSLVSDRLKEAKAELHNIAAENERRTKKNTRIQVILEQTHAYLEELTGIRGQLEHQEEILSNLTVLKKAFSTNGILAYKIENMVKELEALTNTYLAELSDGRFTIEFVVSNDKLNVEITDNGEIVDITALSSGELARVNTSTLIAIRKLMNSISKSRINVLFLDEVIAVLDDTGREKLVEVLIKEENLNTFIVSHEWAHPLLAKLTVIKENGVSRVDV